MLVSVNGERRELPEQATVASVVALMSESPAGRGLAVAVAGEVVPRGQWATTPVADGDQIEVVGAVQGG